MVVRVFECVRWLGGWWFRALVGGSEGWLKVCGLVGWWVDGLVGGLGVGGLVVLVGWLGSWLGGWGLVEWLCWLVGWGVGFNNKSCFRHLLPELQKGGRIGRHSVVRPRGEVELVECSENTILVLLCCCCCGVVVVLLWLWCCCCGCGVVVVVAVVFSSFFVVVVLLLLSYFINPSTNQPNNQPTNVPASPGNTTNQPH